MFDLNSFFQLINSPIGVGVFAGSLTLIYLVLMSINSYLPPILILSTTIGYIVYHFQKNCPVPINNPLNQQQPPQQQPPLPQQQQPTTVTITQ